MFDSVTDVFISVLGVGVLLICANIFFLAVVKSAIAQRIICCVSLLCFGIFVFGALFLREESEEILYIAFLAFIGLCVLLLFGYMVRGVIRSTNEYIQISEIEKQCRSCEFFLECEECFIKNCPYYQKSIIYEFEE